MKIRLDRQGVNEDAQEPVESEEGGVDGVLLKVAAQVGKLFP